MNQSGTAPLAVIVAASLWGIIGLFTRFLGASGLNPLQITEVRCLITAFVIFSVLFIFDRKLLKISLKDIPVFIGTGIFSVALFSMLYFTAAEMTTLSMAAVLLYTAPCFVVVLSAVLFKEKITSVKVLALSCAFAGCVFTSGIIGGSGDISIPGVLIGIGSGFGYALYSIFGKYALKKYHPFTVTFYTFFIAALGLLPFSDLSGFADADLSPAAYMNMAALGIISTAVPYFLYTYGLNRMDAGKAAVLAFAEPMVATAAGFIFYGEALSLSGAAGIILILASVVMLNVNNVPRRGPERCIK